MTELVYVNGELFHAEDLSEDTLAHYGVAGMKWGKRTLRKKNAEVSGKHLAIQKSITAEYKAKKAKIKADYKTGKIDKATAKAAIRKTGDKYVNISDKAFERNAAIQDGNFKKRKQAVKSNKADLKAANKAYRKEGPVARRLLSNRVTEARATGATRKQALANAYTGNYTKKMIYDR